MNCQGYTSYHINIWGLKEPKTNRAVGQPITDQQVTNIIRHLQTCHGVPRDYITWAHLPQMQPPFPGMLAPFVHEMDVIEETFFAENYCSYVSPVI